MVELQSERCFWRDTYLGLLVGLLLIFTAGIYALKRKYPVGERIKLSIALKYLLKAVPSLFLLVLIIGGIISGIFTPTEAAAVAVIYALILSMLVYKEIDLKDLVPILVNTCKNFWDSTVPGGLQHRDVMGDGLRRPSTEPKCLDVVFQ